MADLSRRHQHGRPRYGWDAIAAADLPPHALMMPPGFVFGAATAAHQVEGFITGNNWTEWERGRRPDGGPRIADDQRCGEAVDHWRRFDEDLGLMRWLGLTGYRFSVEWSRIEPLPGYFEAEPLHRYRRWCVQLLNAGITPMVTLHHFTEPTWITERGGFESRSTVTAFVRFVEHVVGHLGDLVGFWTTVNEPVGYAVQGWWRGEWPPGRTDPAAAARVLENLLLAHADAYRTIHQLAHAGRTPQVGLAHNIVAFRPGRRHHPLDRLAARLLDTAYNRAALDALVTGELRLRLPGLRYVAAHPQLCGTQDYLGLNHYYPMTARLRPSLAAPLAVEFADAGTHNDLGWSLDPTSLTEALDLASGYGLPIVILEHGTCDREIPDLRRRRYLAHSLAVLRDAIERGVVIRGYVHWSLLDNFEWSEGFTPRFGLFRVNRETQRRSATSTAHFYRDVIAAQPADDTTRADRP